MKQKLTPRWLIIKLTGALFAAYSAYNLFIIYRDHDALPSEGILISAVVALLFAVLAAFAWTSDVKVKNGLFRMIRKTAFIITLLAVFVLKIRIADRVAAFITYPEYPVLQGILYGGAYFMTLAGILILFIYYTFIRKNIPFFPKLAVILPSAALALFLLSLIFETILFFAYGIMIEASVLRNVVMRPVFYLGFIGLSVYFLFPLKFRHS